MLLYTMYEIFINTKLSAGSNLLDIHWVSALMAGIELSHPTPPLPVKEEDGVCLNFLKHRIDKGEVYADAK